MYACHSTSRICYTLNLYVNTISIQWDYRCKHCVCIFCRSIELWFCFCHSYYYYRWTFLSGGKKKTFFTSIFDTSIENVKPFQMDVVEPNPHFYMSLAIDCVLDLFLFFFLLFIANSVIYSVHANRMLCIKCKLRPISNSVFVYFVNSKNSWMGKDHRNFIYKMVNAHRTLYICKFSIYIAYNENKHFKWNLILNYYFLFNCALCATLYRMPNAECTRAN